MSQTTANFRLGVLASHPIQYQAPIFRELARQVDLVVHFAHEQTPQGQADAGFGVAFEWDSDLLAGYEHVFLQNIAAKPGPGHFFGCNTPGIRQHIRNGNFSAFLVMGWNLLSYWQAVSVCRKLGIVVMSRGDSHLETPGSSLKKLIKKILYPWMLNRFDAHLFVGLHNKAYLSHYGVAEEKLFFSPHCISGEQFARNHSKNDQPQCKIALGENPSTVVLLFCGRLVEFKRVHDLLDAIGSDELAAMDLCLLLAGDGPLRESLQKRVTETGLKVRFLGFRNQSQLPQIYTAADLVVLPSSGEETWGLVVNEALACGTPVVVSDKAGSSADMVVANETGMIYSCGNIPALVQAIVAALKIEQGSAAIAARNRIYSVSNAAAGIISAAEKILERKKHG